MAADPPAVKFRQSPPARHHQTDSNLWNILREILRYRSQENPTHGGRDRLNHHEAFWGKPWDTYFRALVAAGVRRDRHRCLQHRDRNNRGRGCERLRDPRTQHTRYLASENQGDACPRRNSRHLDTAGILGEVSERASAEGEGLSEHHVSSNAPTNYRSNENILISGAIGEFPPRSSDQCLRFCPEPNSETAHAMVNTEPPESPNRHR